MQDLKELNEVIAGIKDEICKGAETLTTSRSVYEFKKTFLDNKQGRIGLLMKEMRNVPKRPERLSLVRLLTVQRNGQTSFSMNWTRN